MALPHPGEITDLFFCSDILVFRSSKESNTHPPSAPELMYCNCCCVIVLRPGKASKVMSRRSVNLTTLPGQA